MEQWKDIEGYEGLYQVSNMGRVKRLPHTTNGLRCNATYDERICTEYVTDDGYKRVGLHKDGKTKFFGVHRLVAVAFIPKPEGMTDVNHIDENKSNNVVDNLEWCTRGYNTTYGSRVDRAAKSNWKKVNQYDLDGNFIRTWDSEISIKKELGWQVCLALKCKMKTCHNYIWKYV